MKESLELVQAFHDKKVLLIGDTIVDIYVYGNVLGTSAETPTIVAREIETKTFLGGAFLVARHLLELGACLSFATLVGEDPGASNVTGFAHPNLTLLPVTDEGRKTTIKKRFWVDGYKLLQFDQLDNRPLAKTTSRSWRRGCARPRTERTPSSSRTIATGSSARRLFRAWWPSPESEGSPSMLIPRCRSQWRTIGSIVGRTLFA